LPLGRRLMQRLHISFVFQGQPLRVILLLRIIIWFALLTGLIEVSILAVKQAFFHQPVFLSPHATLMAPVADVLIFSVPGLILVLVAWRWPRSVSLRNVTFILALLSFLSLLLMVSWLHEYAVLILSVGLAAQAARLTAAHPRGFQSVVKYTFLLVIAIVLGLLIAMSGGKEFTERRVLAHLPDAHTGAPNVLLIVLDTVRAENLSLYGYRRPTTPHLEQIAKKGVVFERAISTAPWTLPSHASMFTGRYPHEVSADWVTPLDNTYPTLAEALTANGYATAGFVGNLVYCISSFGLNRGFTHYEDNPALPLQLVLSSSLSRTISKKSFFRPIVGNNFGDRLERQNGAEINEGFLRWLSQNTRRPFFAFLNYFDAHEPYLAPEPFDAKFGSRTPRRIISDSAMQGRWLVGKNISAERIQREIDAYDGCIAYLDHQLGLLFDELEKRGVLENTIVIITSDHGEQFGDHGFFSHSYSLYWPALNVPLLVSFPSRLPQGSRVSQPVTLRDIPATVVDLLKLQTAASFPGDSLARYWDRTGDKSGGATSILLSEASGQLDRPDLKAKSVIADHYHYIRNNDGREELYDLENDSPEEHDLASSEDGRKVIERLRKSL
jgi:arylsulfatase A-like enzyme